MPKIDAVQALSSMAEQWNKNTEKLVTLAVGMAMQRFGVSEVSFTTVELEEFARRHIVTKEHADSPHGLAWTIKVLPVNPHPGQGNLDLQAS